MNAGTPNAQYRNTLSMTSARYGCEGLGSSRRLYGTIGARVTIHPATVHRTTPAARCSQGTCAYHGVRRGALAARAPIAVPVAVMAGVGTKAAAGGSLLALPGAKASLLGAIAAPAAGKEAASAASAPAAGVSDTAGPRTGAG